MVAHQAALPDTLSYEEPAGDLHPHHGVQHRLVDSPRPEGLLLRVGDLGGHVTDGHGDVSGRRGRKLDLSNSIQCNSMDWQCWVVVVWSEVNKTNISLTPP